MAAWRYEISLLVLKKYFTRSLRSLVKYFSTRREISYLRAPMKYPLCMISAENVFKVHDHRLCSTPERHKVNVLVPARS